MIDERGALLLTFCAILIGLISMIAGALVRAGALG